MLMLNLKSERFYLFRDMKATHYEHGHKIKLQKMVK